MSVPDRILTSRQMRTFMDWFELCAVIFFFWIIAAIALLGLVALIAWLS